MIAFVNVAQSARIKHQPEQSGQQRGILPLLQKKKKRIVIRVVVSYVELDWVFGSHSDCIRPEVSGWVNFRLITPW